MPVQLDGPTTRPEGEPQEDYLSWTFAMDYRATRNYLLQTTQGTLPGAPYNETHWKNDAWQAIAEEAFRTPDEAKRNELIAEASTIEYNEGGNIVWEHDVVLDAYDETKLGGLVHDVWGVSAMGYRFWLCHIK